MKDKYFYTGNKSYQCTESSEVDTATADQGLHLKLGETLYWY